MPTIIQKNFELRAERECLDWTPLSRPDFAWRHIDTVGHVHEWEKDKPWYESGVPTVRWVWDEEPDDEYDGRGHHECATCGEKVPTPGILFNDEKVYRVGLTQLSGKVSFPEKELDEITRFTRSLLDREPIPHTFALENGQSWSFLIQVTSTEGVLGTYKFGFVVLERTHSHRKVRTYSGI